MEGFGIGLDPADSLDPVEGQKEILRFIQKNIELEHKGRFREKFPIGLWGETGIGKSEMVEGLAASQGWPLVKKTLAEFQEMGDVLGLPDKVRGTTEYAIPGWAPRSAGPGILLLDDFNRGEIPMLSGCMGLLRDFSTSSWSLPPFWQIVLTGNLDAARYIIAEMDPAMITRVKHLLIRFDARAYVQWATEAGIDERCRDFVLYYPESITGIPTTARTITRFFRAIEDIQDFGSSLERIQKDGIGLISKETSTAFRAFVKDDLPFLVAPEAILCAKNFRPVAKEIERMVVKDGKIRVDRMNVMLNRVFRCLTKGTVDMSAVKAKNLVDFLLLECMPADLRLSFWRDIMDAESPPGLADLLKDPRLAVSLLGV